LKELLVGLAVLAVSGITFLAYKHPEGYKSLQGFIGVFLLAILIGTGVWDFALSDATRAISDYSPSTEIKGAIKGLKSPGWLWLSIIGLLVYLWLLLFLPEVTDKDDDNSKAKNND
jgi:hypothetical protein